MEQRFKNLHVVISGAGRDFGRTLALMMARSGATVHLSARSLAAAEQTADIINKQGGTAYADVCDVADIHGVNQWAKVVSERTPVIDCLFLNAGRWEDESDLELISDIDVASIINSSLTGGIMMTKAFLPLVRVSQRPDIIAMVSICGVDNYTDSPANPAFYAAKHGLSGFCEVMAKRLHSEGIRVTAVYPPDFDNIEPDSESWEANQSEDGLLTSRSIWEAIAFTLAQPRECRVEKLVFNGLRWDQV